MTKRFSATGETGLVAFFRNTDKSLEVGFEGTFAAPVADHRDQEQHDAKSRALTAFAWSLWSGAFDEIMQLCAQYMQNIAISPFLWHRYLQENTNGVGEA